MSKPPFAATMYWPSLEEIREHQDLGLRPVVLWLPEGHAPNFVSEARRQLTDLMHSESNEDEEILDFIDSHFDDLWSDKEWT